MRLTSFTDYTLRTLLHLGTNPGRLVTIQEIADLHSISKNHLMKVVNELARNGVIETVRGRNGGFRLAHAPKDINIGAIVRMSESDFYMAECFDPGGTPCGLVTACGLKGVLGSATAAFLAELDRHTLATLLPEPAPREMSVVMQQRKTA
ncbi:Rrf2 family transcriptional regulator [Massilia sp. YIM B02443]|uniref:RrF2 family transcriptional regulator n=1 Tax=Massilia sp. YIM B02443 TaxID=3050127 RepID=UPI0025B73267|nr:Rrf2 family transcriptional regulator [Massilia sp. YIM B02443]MDN4035771.1 Rrf2 family transcriptional regulator [Massilia sp. YIM B02443]